VRLERKTADNDRKDLGAILLEHKLKTSAEANEEYKKKIVELQEKVKGKADWGRMETSSA
jgi:hypothetical protein